MGGRESPRRLDDSRPARRQPLAASYRGMFLNTIRPYLTWSVILFPLCAAWVENIAVSHRLAALEEEFKKLQISGGAPAQGPSYAALRAELSKSEKLLAAERHKSSGLETRVAGPEAQVKSHDQEMKLATNRKNTAISDL